jgi:ribokinase
MKRTLLVVGSVNVDAVSGVERFPAPGETVLASSYRQGLGGKGANQAVAAALDGARVELVARTGDDAGGAAVRTELAGWGVDVTDVAAVPGVPTGIAQILVDARGENMIAVSSGANDALDAAAVDALADRLGPGMTVLSQGEVPVEVLDRLAEVCRDRGARFVLNLAPPRDVAPRTLRTADPLVVNEHEARTLGLDGADPEDWRLACAAAAGRLAEAVVVTLGARGAVAATCTSSAYVAAPVVDAVDATGAGDAFVGVLASRLAVGVDLGGAVQSAVAAASQAVTRHGTVESYPRR